MHLFSARNVEPGETIGFESTVFPVHSERGTTRHPQLAILTTLTKILGLRATALLGQSPIENECHISDVMGPLRYGSGAEVGGG